MNYEDNVIETFSDPDDYEQSKEDSCDLDDSYDCYD